MCEKPYATDAYNFFPHFVMGRTRVTFAGGSKNFSCHFSLKWHYLLIFGEKNIGRKGGVLTPPLFVGEEKIGRRGGSNPPLFVGEKKIGRRGEF